MNKLDIATRRGETVFDVEERHCKLAAKVIDLLRPEGLSLMEVRDVLQTAHRLLDLEVLK